MSMDDILKALMQSAATSQQTQQPSSSGTDAMAQMLGGMLGQSQQSPAQPQSGGDAMAQMLGGMLGGQTQGTGSGDLVGQAIGGLLGGQQGGGVGGLLGGLQQIIGGTPGTGQQLPLGGSGMGLGAANPLMGLLQPVVNNLAAKLGISPQIATVLASIALHYLLQSSPRTPGASPLNLGSVMQSMSSGRSVSTEHLQQSGIVTDVMQATGMDEQQAVRSLNTTFGILGTSLQPSKAARKSTTRKSTSKTRKTTSTKRTRR